MKQSIPFRGHALSAFVLIWVVSGCTHALQVKNLDLYAAPTRLQGIDQPIKVAVMPFSGNPDETYYFNALLDRIHQSPSVTEVRTDYIAGKGGSFQPDVILSMKPEVNYRSSGWNFLINWPGFLIFTPAWNGYVYHADIVTHVAIHDGSGTMASEESIPVSYSIREAQMDRTIWTGLTWIEVSVLALLGGIYNAFVFDHDIVGELQNHVKDNYATYVGNQIRPKILAAAEASRATAAAQDPPAAATWEETGPEAPDSQ